MWTRKHTGLPLALFSICQVFSPLADESICKVQFFLEQSFIICANRRCLECLKVKVLVNQSRPILCDPMGGSPPGSSVHEISQARIMEWVAIPFSRWSFQPRDLTQVSHVAGRFFIIWAIYLSKRQPSQKGETLSSLESDSFIVQAPTTVGCITLQKIRSISSFRFLIII